MASTRHASREANDSLYKVGFWSLISLIKEPHASIPCVYVHVYIRMYVYMCGSCTCTYM